MTGAKLRSRFAGRDALDINTPATVIQWQSTALLTSWTASQAIFSITATSCELLVDASCSFRIESSVTPRIWIHRVEIRIELIGRLNILILAWSICAGWNIRDGGG